MKINYLQASPGSLTSDKLKTLDASTIMYMHDYQDYFTWNKDPSVNSTKLKTIVEYAKQEGTLKGKDPTSIYSELIELDGIGVKTALVMTLALTAKIPDMVPIIAKTLIDNLFTGIDDSLMQCSEGTIWERYNLFESSTVQPKQSVSRFIQAKAGQLIKLMSLTDKYNIPVEKVYAYLNSILCDVGDGNVSTKDLVSLENKFNTLCKETTQNRLNIDNVNAWITSKANYLDDDQKNAIREYLCNDRKVNLLIGIAGSGKSAVIQSIWTLLSELSGEALVTSYMNKAVSNLKERIVDYRIGGDIMRGFVSTSLRVQFTKPDSKFGNAVSKCKYLIIDESSVISSNHLKYINAIIDAMHKDVKILYVGDPSQLHPVKEHGYPFIRACEKYTANKLTGFHRSNGYDIKRIADSVRYENKLAIDKSTDEVLLYGGKLKSVIKSIVTKYKNSTKVIDFGVITPTNAIKDEVNRALFAKLAPDEVIQSYVAQQEGRSYKVKLPILWNGARVCVDVPIKSNDVDFVKNQILKIKEVGKLKSTVITESEIEYKVLNKEIETSCSLGFCMTVHKYQGSELNTCLYITPKDCGAALRFFRQSNLVYVAISRAKEKLIIYEIDEYKEKMAEIENINYVLIDPPTRKMTF